MGQLCVLCGYDTNDPAHLLTCASPHNGTPINGTPVDSAVPPGWSEEAYAEAHKGMTKAAGKLDSEEGQAWKAAALEAIWAVATAQEEFIVDDVWAAMACEPWEKTRYGSSLGPLMKAMAKDGWMSGQTHVRSGRGPTHGHTVVVWKSNIYNPYTP